LPFQRLLWLLLLPLLPLLLLPLLLPLLLLLLLLSVVCKPLFKSISLLISEHERD